MSSPTYVRSGVGSERVHYFPRQLISADDMTVEQEYFRQKLRRHNRFLHGWGVVCGLNVTAAPTNDIPWQVKIDGGYALSPQGDEIYVAEPVCLDLAKCGLATVADPCEPSRPPTHVPIRAERLFVAIKYVECETRPVRVHPIGCACDEADCEYSRIRDDFKIECLTELPPSHQLYPTPRLICALHSTGQSPSCQPCPPEPWVVLAKVALPAATTENIADDHIDNSTVRKQLYSAAVLQQQLIAFCPGLRGNGEDYVTQDGDRLSELADRFLGNVLSWPAIFYYANLKHAVDPSYARILDPDLPLEQGRKIYIPSSEEAEAYLAGS